MYQRKFTWNLSYKKLLFTIFQKHREPLVSTMKRTTTGNDLWILKKALLLGDTDTIIGIASNVWNQQWLYENYSPLRKRTLPRNNKRRIYLYLLTYTWCKDLKPNPQTSCRYYHNVLHSTSWYTLLSMIEFEKTSKTTNKKEPQLYHKICSRLLQNKHIVMQN